MINLLIQVFRLLHTDLGIWNQTWLVVLVLIEKVSILILREHEREGLILLVYTKSQGRACSLCLVDQLRKIRVQLVLVVIHRGNIVLSRDKVCVE